MTHYVLAAMTDGRPEWWGALDNASNDPSHVLSYGWVCDLNRAEVYLSVEDAQRPHGGKRQVGHHQTIVQSLEDAAKRTEDPAYEGGLFLRDYRRIHMRWQQKALIVASMLGAIVLGAAGASWDFYERRREPIAVIKEVPIEDQNAYRQLIIDLSVTTAQVDKLTADLTDSAHALAIAAGDRDALRERLKFTEAGAADLTAQLDAALARPPEEHTIYRSVPVGRCPSDTERLNRLEAGRWRER